MEAPRLTPWVQFSAREWRRDLITVHGNHSIIRMWGRNKRGTAMWQWATINAAFYHLDPNFLKSAKLGYHYTTSKVWNRKIDAIRDADEKLKNSGFLLLKNKHLSFL